MGSVVLVAGNYEGIAPCVFVDLECVENLVYYFVVSSYVKAFYVWVGVGGEQVWPHVDFVVLAKCTIGLGFVSS
jgi:hypothetical protein